MDFIVDMVITLFSEKKQQMSIRINLIYIRFIILKLSGYLFQKEQNIQQEKFRKVL